MPRSSGKRHRSAATLAAPDIAAKPVETAAAGQRVLRVLTCNLLSGRARAKALLELIEAEAVDIVCAQELSVPLAAALADILPYGDLSHEQIARGNGIASRQPVTVARIAMPKRDGWIAALDPGHWPQLARPIEIVNVHIAGPHLWPYFPHPVRRRAQLEALLAYRQRRNDLPHAILGDFNSTPAWPVYRRLRRYYVDAAMQAAGDGVKPAATWPHLPVLGITGLLRIDHCFLWRLNAVTARPVTIPGSDHRGLLLHLTDLPHPGHP